MIRHILSLTFILSDLLSFGQITTIPYRLINNLMIVEVTVNDQTGNMILDTGAPCIILNSNYFKNQTGIPVHGTKSTLHNYQTGYATVTLENITFHGRETLSTDLTALEHQKGIPLLGLLDVSMLRHFTLHLDPFRQVISLQKNPIPSQLPYLNHPNTSVTCIKFRKSAHLMVLPTTLNGKNILLGLDTGSEVNVFHPKWTQEFPTLQYYPNKKLMNVNGTTQQSPFTYLKGKLFDALPPCAMGTVFAPLPQSAQLSAPHIDGLIGMEFLKHYHMLIDFKKRTLIFWTQPGISPPMKQKVPFAKQ